jgi:alpha-tubulin suppressor-like RCC1 family protein
VTVLPHAASVAIVFAPDSLIVPGSDAIGAVAKNAAGETLPGRRFTWESSNPALAAVDQLGIVSALAPGSVTITARSTVVSASVTIRVLPQVARVEISPAGAVVPIGRTFQFTAVTRDAQGQVITGRPVDWTVDNTEIMSVDGNGLVQSITAGTARVIATVDDSISATADVTSQMDGPLASLGAGERHTCGVATTGSVYCWGGNVLGQLGPSPGSGAGPVLVPSPEQFASLAAGGSHTCALNQAGAAFCWGSNSFGQLGATSGAPGEVLAVSGGLAFTRISAGFEYTCGLEANGSAWCWGYNEFGTLGRGTDDLLPHTTPAAVLGGHAFTSIDAGVETTCALTAAGEAWCWGGNRFGNLGLGTQDDGPHSTPVHAASGLTFSAIAVALGRTCGIAAAGVVYCWGQDQLTPAPFDGTGGSTELDIGAGNVCRVNGAGTVSCVGDEDLGHVPQELVARLTIGSHHGCARLVASGKFVCWGSDGNGQLGTGAPFAGPDPVEPLGQP